MIGAAVIKVRRSGAALVLALLAIIVLDCIVLGTLHVALQEHRIGANRSTVLQLRLDAEGGARRALGFWTVEIDSMHPGGSHRIRFPAMATAPAQVEIERIDERLYVVESIMTEPPPRVGRASARLLVHPPALPPGVEGAPVPVSSTGAVHIAATGRILATPPAGCDAVSPAHSISMAPSHPLTVMPGAFLEAPAASPAQQPVLEAFRRIADLAPSLLIAADTIVASDGDGVLLVDGSIGLTDTAAFRGLLVTSGSVTIGPGASVAGAVHAAGGIAVEGLIQWDGCAVRDAVRAARLDRPREATSRAWLPSF